MNVLSEAITNGLSTLLSIAVKSDDSTWTIAPEALIAWAIAAPTAAAAPPAAAPLVISGSLPTDSPRNSNNIVYAQEEPLFKGIPGPLLHASILANVHKKVRANETGCGYNNIL